MKLHPTLPSWYRMLRGSSTGKTTMFTVRLSRRELQAENESLRAALEQAKVSLAEFRLQEHDLADVLVGARAEARDLVESARTEARDLVERAQTEARELSESARTNSTTRAMPMMIDCSRAMIRPPIAWSVPAVRPQ